MSDDDESTQRGGWPNMDDGVILQDCRTLETEFPPRLIELAHRIWKSPHVAAIVDTVRRFYHLDENALQQPAESIIDYLAEDVMLYVVILKGTQQYLDLISGTRTKWGWGGRPISGVIPFFNEIDSAQIEKIDGALVTCKYISNVYALTLPGNSGKFLFYDNSYTERKEGQYLEDDGDGNTASKSIVWNKKAVPPSGRVMGMSAGRGASKWTTTDVLSDGVLRIYHSFHTAIIDAKRRIAQQQSDSVR